MTVSGQLNVESYACSLNKVYTFGPTFRAENSNTSRHLAEFWMIEPEIAFADLADNARLAEHFLQSVVSEVMQRCADDLAFFEQRVDSEIIARLQNVSSKPFTSMTYTEAVNLLQPAAQNSNFQWLGEPICSPNMNVLFASKR